MAKDVLSHLSEGDHVGAHIDKVGNGYIVRVTSEKRGKNGSDGPAASYESKQLIAPDGTAALRIASAHFVDAKPKKKKGERKRGNGKMRVSKR